MSPSQKKGSAEATFERIRKFCLSLPDTTEKIAGGELTYRVRERIFVMFDNNHHHGDQIAIWCSAPDGAQEALVASDPKNFFVPPYVGKGGWLGVRVDCGLPFKTLVALVEQAYHTTAAKGRGKRRR